MSISLSLSPRRCTDRYAFRAGWNLPDKKFCSLRTIIVTAAIYRGFSRWLSCHQVRVVRIFTDMSISPSLSPRQCPDRYAFRAGRNLPDKEFRYLRTVIVTAAVHRGFGRRLPLSSGHQLLDLPALGRR
ncbi:hypothetical protein GOBAR_AA19795 [Gossypium barbadense]|uniref:Uncharacterized protein n=1 Tax=Gossypium barbadense TaxID=3634 RepID=A0A2P5XC00_GOSBA|nr:hypothetical protein GOBAR_AA19795 [Gossypium barbadense]